MLCIRKFLVAKKFIDKREGEVSRFPLNLFCFKVSKNAEREPFSVSLISGIEKKMDERVGGGRRECQDFPSKFSCLPVPKIS